MTSSSGSDRTRRRWIVVGTAIAVAWIVLRDLSLWSNPRLHAEEGSFFFARAFAGAGLFSREWLEVGYVDLVPIVGAWTAANLFPLERAPFVMTAWAALAVALPIVLVLGSRSRLFDSGLSKLLALIAILIPASRDANWLNTLQSKFLLALVPLILLADSGEPDSSGKARRFDLFLAFLSGFGNIVAAFLAPLFVVRWVRRERGRLRTVAAAFLFGVLLHVVVAVTGHPDRGLPNLSAGARFTPPNPASIGTSAVLDGLAPQFLGAGPAGALVENLREFTADGGFAVAGVQVACWLILTVLAALARTRGGPLTLELAWALITAGCLCFALRASGTALALGVPSRYFIPGSTIVVWMLLGSARDGRGAMRLVPAALCASFLSSFFAFDFRPATTGKERPVWSRQIEQWRSSPDHPIRISPEPWVVILDRSGSSRAGVARVFVGERPSGLVLEATPPLLGGATVVRLDGVAPKGKGFILVQPGPPVAARTIPGFPDIPCVVPDPVEASTRLPFEADGNGSWSLSFPLERVDMFAGQVWTLQAFQLEPQVVASDGLILTLGH